MSVGIFSLSITKYILNTAFCMTPFYIFYFLTDIISLDDLNYAVE